MKEGGGEGSCGGTNKRRENNFGLSHGTAVNCALFSVAVSDV